MKWSEEEISYLIENYPKSIPLKDILFKLGRTKRAISHKAVRLGLARGRIPYNRPKNPEHRKQYDKNYYENHKEIIYNRKIKRLKLYKMELANLLGGKCGSCGYHKCMGALEFHHISNNKESAIASILKNYSKQKALKETKKCILLCANCHRELHYKGS